MLTERNEPLQVLKSVGPKLVPFFKTCAIYFVLFTDASKLESMLYCVTKCLPIISLIIFVLLHGMSFSEYYSYSRNIMIGLILCCIGDAFMVWKSDGYFVHSMFFFGLGHVFYTMALGFKPLNIPVGLTFVSLIVFIYSFLYQGLKGCMIYFVPIYMTLLGIMVWRAIAKVRFFDDLWTWTKLCSCVGALLFAVSDTILALNAFYAPVPYSHQLIMTTYYAAQLGIALSVVDSQVDALLSKESHPKRN